MNLQIQNTQQQYMTFYLGQHLFGISILLVREINQNLDITPVSKVPKYIRGVLNLRGQVVTVMDLAKRLSFDGAEGSQDASCIVLKTNTEIDSSDISHSLDDRTLADKVGLYVDRIGDVLNIASKEIIRTPTRDSKLDKRFIKGVVRLNDQLLILLNLKEVLNPEQKGE
ncbi:MAG: chemotaxis protein CheW [Puniceicoccaceae bacterium]